MLPAAIWPYLWALCLVLGVLCWITSQGAAWRALTAIMAAYVTVRVVGVVFEGHDIKLALFAFVWAATASAVNHLNNTAGGRIIAAAALCYFWAAASGAPQVVGSIPFVASDVLMTFAMLWIGWDGIAAMGGRIRDLVSRRIGYSGGSFVASIPEKTPRQKREAR